MVKKEQTPRRRFREFKDDGEWCDQTIQTLVSGDISDGDWIEQNHIFDEGKYRIIQTGNLGIGQYQNKFTTSKFFHQEDFDILKANEIFPNDILISRLAEPAGRTIILPDTGSRMVTAVDVTIVRPNNNFDSYFFMTIMNSFENLKKINKHVTGTTHKRISRKNLEQIQLVVPKNKNEQQKIGVFFSKLDSLIELHKQKLNKLKNMKSAYLVEMFPVEGVTVPKRRFAGFTGEWEEFQLGEVVNFFSGLTYSPNNVQKEGVLVLRSSNVKDGEVVDADNVYVKPQVVNCTLVEQGDIVVVVRNGSRHLIGKHATIKQHMMNTVIGAFMIGIRSKTPSFIQSLLNTEKFAIEVSKNLGATINQITIGDFNNMRFLFPQDIEEQQKIGEFFQQLDSQILLHQNKLDRLQSLKQAYLNEMFV